jgi:hypothetical protein
MLNDVFKITSFIDQARWSKKSHYGQVNFYKSDLPDDTKILTHWLCYITDRQTAFERVWDVGGFIFSELVDTIKKEKDLNLLNPKSDKSFYIRRGDYTYKELYNINSADYDKQLFVSRSKVGKNERLIRYNLKPDTTAYFIPRYYPADYRSILSTFCILYKYNFNLTKYIIVVLSRLEGDENLIPKLLFSLYLLTYFEIKQPEYTDILYSEKELEKAKSRADQAIEIINSDNLFTKGFEKFKKGDIYNQKRAWCSLRDFFKSPEFSKYFFNSVDHEGYKNVSSLKSEKLLTQFELPGDVWNNNPKFRSCILRGTKYQKKSKDSLAKILRDMYNNEDISEGYPEQFDITFDLVPRMCEKDNCDICPYNIINGKNKEFEKLCIQDESYYCPVLLTSCNYRMKCKGAECKLYKIYEEYHKHTQTTKDYGAGLHS